MQRLMNCCDKSFTRKKKGNQRGWQEKEEEK
jgi:hypothetical protein